MPRRLAFALVVVMAPAVVGRANQGPAGPIARPRSITDMAARIERAVDASSRAPVAATADERVELVSLYSPGVNTPLWVDGQGRPGNDARTALSLLEEAAAEGLDPRDYGAEALRTLAAALEAAERPSLDDVAAFDVGVSVAMLRYLRHVHLGRVDPRRIGFRVDVPVDGHDFAALLRSAIGDHRIRETADGLRPPLAQYRLLRDALGRYRTLAADSSLSQPPRFEAVLRPGGSDAGVPLLRRYLIAVGDLAGNDAAPADATLYDDGLVDAVTRFQERHGLDPDGIIGRATQAALQMPLSWRVRQIEMALERLRWLPDLADGRLIALNIPMFHLWGWDSIGATGVPSFGQRAIVGRAVSTQTPILIEEMRYVIFRPYWNVPRSILRNELLPAIRRDVDYLHRNDMEIVRGTGDNAQPVAPTPGNIALLEQGLLRLRQRPGPDNSLGLAKFVFPNDENIYLHGTPAQALFSRTRRDFSHGCVRVEDPAALAEWVLNDQPEWTRERIVEAMSGSRPRQVNLTRPLRVVLFYLTAAVMPDDGTVRFADDIYRHDERLDTAMGRV